MKNVVYRSLNVFMSISLMFYSLFGSLLVVKAGTSYLGRTTTDVNFRSKATTDNNDDGTSNVIMEIDGGTIVTVLDSTKITGNGCSAGWLAISYDEKSGFLCSALVNDASVDTYGRPWNTPKKAIVGGAKWISVGYISKGQFTSYLKKFNVNPNGINGINGLFNHQYMANLAAPSSEAASSYTAYKNNNLFDLPLVFNIPIYKNMGTNYDRPTGNLTTLTPTITITDTDFEAKLDAQGFDESYKQYLRTIHLNHRSWTFVAMNTNIDFNEAVNVEKTVSSINGNSAFYELDENGNKTSTEAGWYLPNYATTAYYLDPRNFLTDKYILQFESLEYSDVYTEDIVQSILYNTFMSGNSSLDNQSYKSIFVEAGKNADVSPVYLASLARQESGTDVAMTTSGAAFTYTVNSVTNTYSGLFNFFNIGAYSSADNPAKQGLIYASGGYCKICDTYNGQNSGGSSTNPVNPTPTPSPVVSATTSMNNLGLNVNNGYVRGFNLGSSVANLRSVDGNVSFSNDGTITTGTVLSFADGAKYTAVIYGDLNGDGSINSADLLAVRQYLLGMKDLSGAYKEAANLNGDGSINSATLLKIRQHLLGIANINQL